MVKQTKNPPNHSVAVTPELSLALPKQVAKPTSKIPPIINKIQFIFSVLESKLTEPLSATHFLNPQAFSNFHD